MTTATAESNILFTETRYRDRNLSLDDLKTALERRIGLPIQDRDHSGDERFSRCMLDVLSPTGITLFDLEVSRSTDQGWHLTGGGHLLQDDMDAMHHLHEDEIRIEIVKDGDDVLRRTYETDGTANVERIK